MLVKEGAVGLCLARTLDALDLEFRSHSLQNEDRSDLFPNQIAGAKEEVSVEEYV